MKVKCIDCKRPLARTHPHSRLGQRCLMCAINAGVYTPPKRPDATRN